MDVELIKTIANLGFPAVVAMFLLLRLNGTLEKIKTALNENTVVTQTLSERIERVLERIVRP